MCHFGNVLHRVGIPVTPHKEKSVRRIQRRQESVDRRSEFFRFIGFLHAVAVCENFLQIIQREVVLAVSDHSCIGMILLCRKVARNPADKRPQRAWPVGRDGIPSPEICIVHTLLSILLIAENIPRHSRHCVAVLFGKLVDCLF